MRIGCGTLGFEVHELRGCDHEPVCHLATGKVPLFQSPVH